MKDTDPDESLSQPWARDALWPGRDECATHGAELMSIGSSRATKQAARRSVEQGSAQRGAGARLRDATVEPIKARRFEADPCASPGVRSQRVPLPPLDAPRLRGCDRGGAHGHADSIRRAWPAAGSHLRLRAQALLRPPRALLAATRRDGAIWAHLVVGNPCNIDILLRAILLKLHPISPPSHTCLYMK